MITCIAAHTRAATGRPTQWAESCRTATRHGCCSEVTRAAMPARMVRRQPACLHIRLFACPPVGMPGSPPGFARRRIGRARMASYHLSIKTIKRSAGRSATAAAAYRSCRASGQVHVCRNARAVGTGARRLGRGPGRGAGPMSAPGWRPCAPSQGGRRRIWTRMRSSSAWHRLRGGSRGQMNLPTRQGERDPRPTQPGAWTRHARPTTEAAARTGRRA